MPSARLVAVAVVVLTTTVASTVVTLAAQSGAPLAAGVRIRVRTRTTPPDTLVGVLDTIGADTVRLRLRDERAPSRVALSAIEGIDVSQGQRSYGREGAAVGSLVGLLVGLAAESGRRSTSNSFEPDYGRLAAALGIGFGGVVVGYIVGSQMHSEKWEAVPLTGLRIAPVGLSRVAITVSLFAP